LILARFSRLEEQIGRKLFELGRQGRARIFWCVLGDQEEMLDSSLGQSGFNIGNAAKPSSAVFR
jgi:hypothetical protein